MKTGSLLSVKVKRSPVLKSVASICLGDDCEAVCWGALCRKALLIYPCFSFIHRTKIEKEKKEHAKLHGMIRTEISGAEIAEEMEKERRFFQLQMCEVGRRERESRAVEAEPPVQTSSPTGCPQLRPTALVTDHIS